jgi:hypothetical protein
MPIDLRNPSAIPPRLISDLKSFNSRLAREEFLDPLLEDSRFLAIARELNDLCEREGVVGFHFTRSFSEKIKSEGLRSSTGAEWREAFLHEHGARFTADQVDRIKRVWAGYFDTQQDQARDRRVWFNLTINALTDGGAHRLLAHFGGEVVYMPLCSDEEMAQILCQIGRPLVVECDLDTSKLSTFGDNPWSQVLLSSYHRTINSDAYVFDRDCRMLESLPADRVISIHEATDLGWIDSR